MATSPQDSTIRSRPRREPHDVGVDDWIECCVARSWDSFRFTLIDCEHGCIGRYELARCASTDAVTASCCNEICHVVDSCRDCYCHIATVVHNPGFICLYLVSSSTNCTLVEIEKTGYSWFCCVDGDVVNEHCVPVGVGGVFNSLAELGTHRYDNYCIDNIVACCIFRTFECENS